MSQKNLDHVSLILPVIDLAHVAPTISNLADIRQALRVDHLDVQIEIDPTKFPGTDPNDSAAVQKVIDDATARLKQSSQKLQSTFPKEN